MDCAASASTLRGQRNDPRETNMRTRSIAALCMAVLVLTGCASGAEERTRPQGPNGYALSATLDDGSLLWWDRSPESGMTDLIVFDAEGQRAGSCLSGEPAYCIEGPGDAQVVLVIGPAGSQRAVMQWYGEEVELVRGELPAGAGDDALPVFGAVMPPPADQEQGFHLDVLDDAGEVVFSS